MKKAITITVPKPCHENWDEMTSTEKGKFCGVCTKEVVDFSKSSDEELFKKIAKGQNLCGRFNASQLDRKITLERKSKNSLLPYAASLLLPLSLLGGSDSLAQGGPRVFESNYTSLGIGSNPIKSIVTITGFITDENNIPISNAEVFVLETGKSVRTKPDGSYRLVCTSGSTIFSAKGEKNSEHVVLGTRNAEIDLKLKTIVITKKVTTGVVYSTIRTECNVTDDTNNTKEEIQEETIEGEIEVEEIPEISNEATLIIKGKTVAEQLNNKIPICGLTAADSKTKELQKTQVDSVGIIIRGTVSDENGLPLPFVNVIIKNSSIGTQTDLDGNYEIALEENAKLVFSYLGFETIEITASTISNTIDLKMTPSFDVLGEMVYTVGDISFAEEDSDAPETNNSFGYDFPRNDYERKDRIEKRRKAKANEVAFQKIKLEKKKAAKAAKKLKRKRK